jgi:hypothetical protein
MITRHFGWGVEKKMAIVVLVKPRWNHHNISDFQRMFSGKYGLSLASVIEYYRVPEKVIIRPRE